ncbi:MAG: hypothetical protein LBD71_05520 [Treponema sp.]|jgi:hypothetical protein|nr:hypothetical protein [Treponema sp.]
MISPDISRDPVGLIRMKKKDGGFLFDDAECERLLEVYIDRAAGERPPETEPMEGERGGEAAGDAPAFGKPTGRGRLFWVDSE